MPATGFRAYIGKSQKGDPSTQSCTGQQNMVKEATVEPFNSLERLQAGYGVQKRSVNLQGRRSQHESGTNMIIFYQIHKNILTVWN